MKLTEHPKEWWEEFYKNHPEDDCDCTTGNPNFMNEIKEKIDGLAKKMRVTVEELEWVTDFLARNETGLFRFTPRQLEVLNHAYQFRNKSA